MTRVTYSRIERLHFRLFGVWPQRVVERRLAALAEDQQRMRVEAHRQHVAALKAEHDGNPFSREAAWAAGWNRLRYERW